MDDVIDAIRAQYPSLATLARGELEAGVGAGLGALVVPAGTKLFDEGSPCAGFPLVLEGCVRVSRDSSSGRSLELYRVRQGEVCVVSAAGALGARPLTAVGTAIEGTRLALLPPPLFERWTQHPPFRRFVFDVFAERLTDLMTVVDAVAFQRLDRRLAEFLLGHGRELRTTHQALADELGTVREMVTRLLNRFEEAGLVRLGRERVEIVDAVGLRALAAGEPARRADTV